MAYVWQPWLADAFRAAGLTVVEVEGWERRGRPASTGHFEPNGLIVDHHTGTLTSADRPTAGLPTLIAGRSDLPGPLCQYAIDYRGWVYVIAAGRANVNGKARASGTFPAGDGNRYMGVEVMTDGRQPLPAAQVDAIARTNAVVLHHWGRGVDYVHRHEDISLTGKWDIGQLTTAQARTITRAALSGSSTGGFLMALSDAEQQELLTRTRNIDKWLVDKLPAKTTDLPVPIPGQTEPRPLGITLGQANVSAYRAETNTVALLAETAALRSELGALTEAVAADNDLDVEDVEALLTAHREAVLAAVPELVAGSVQVEGDLHLRPRTT